MMKYIPIERFLFFSHLFCFLILSTSILSSKLVIRAKADKLSSSYQQNLEKSSGE